MLNKEKYRDEILDIAEEGEAVAVDVKKNKLVSCYNIDCEDCLFDGSCCQKRKEWLNSEYVEPEVDWNKVPVDTPILVRNSEKAEWEKRHFACIDDGKVCTWCNGTTSWSTHNKDYFCEWSCAKLAEDVEKPQDNAWHNLKNQKPEDRQEVLTWDGLGVHEDRWSDDAD